MSKDRGWHLRAGKNKEMLVKDVGLEYMVKSLREDKVGSSTHTTEDL